MPVINVYVRDEVFSKYKEDENKKGLISTLLENHYNTTEKTEEQIIQEVKDKIAQKIIDEERLKKIEEEEKIKAKKHEYRNQRLKYYETEEGAKEFKEGLGNRWNDVSGFLEYEYEKQEQPNV
jgi:hypothetical protein